MLSNPPNLPTAPAAEPQPLRVDGDRSLVDARERGNTRSDGPAVESGPVLPHEIRAALRLVLGRDGRPAGDAAVAQFVTFVRARNIDLGRTHVIRVGKRIAFAAVPLASPGRTSLVFCPGVLGRGVTEAMAAEAIGEVVAGEGRAGARLLQALVPEEARPLQLAFARCGFEPLATLLYLQRRILPRQAGHRPALPAGYHLERYEEPLYGALAEAIRQSYVRSLDCPELVGKRTVDEAIAGHRAVGEYRPEWWHILMRRTGAGDEPVGALLLAGVGEGAVQGLEVVYLGLAPKARGLGLGDALVRTALHQASATRGGTLTLAADARNAPALKLYRRHGLKRIGRRMAMLCDLSAN